ADEIAWPRRVFVGRVQHERRAAALLLLAVVERREIAAMAAIAREVGRAHPGGRHGPRHEGARPWLARESVPAWMGAPVPVGADLAGEGLAALGEAAAVDVAVGVAAIDHGRAAELGPFLPGGVGHAVGGRPIGIAGARAAAAAAGAEQPGQD